MLFSGKFALKFNVKRTRNIILYSALIFIGLLVFSALAAPLIAPCDPTEQHLQNRFMKPGEGGYLMGTDDLGRDVFSRIIYGSRSALLVGFTTVGAAMLLGLITGLAAGLGNRWIESALMLFTDSLLAFPTILLALTVVTFMGYGLVQVMLALGIIFSPVFTRIVRAETMALQYEGYVEAAKVLGTLTYKIITKHFLPNMMGKLIVQGAITFAASIVIESSLSYLGLGIQPPNASWGLMLKDARSFILTSPYLAIYPGVVIALTVLSFNLIGDILSEKINPRIED